MFRPNLAAWSLPALLAALAATPVAQSADNVLLEEITVTAQRRAELVQEIPLAVTAYSAEQLERLQVTETLDMGRLVPNFIGHNNTGLGTANTYSIRALNNTESIATFDPPVGSYIDDIYVTRQNANNFTLFDVDRIEVLRGPQGTLFGRNTTGGAVRVILKKPAEELGGFIEGGYGEFERYSLRGSIDVPLSDRVLTKLSAYYIEDDGFVDNLTTGEDDLNYEENYGVRGAVLFKITDDLTWDLAVDYIDDDHANMLNFVSGSSRITRTGLSEETANLRGYVSGNKQNFTLGNEVESFNVTSVIDWAIGEAGSLAFITGWRDLDQDFALDFLDNPADWGGFTIANEGNHEQFTQEIKWTSSFGDRLDYVAGIYYIDEDNTTDFGDLFDIGLSFPLVLADRVLDNTTEAWAAYFQGDYHFTDKWTITAGVRYTDEDKDVAIRDNRPCLSDGTGGCNFDDDGNSATPSVFLDTNGDGIDDFDLATANFFLEPTDVCDFYAVRPAACDDGDPATNVIFFQNQPLPTKQNEQIWTPRLAVQYQASADLQLYASATRGFKSGGWNARGTEPSQLLNFDPEIVWSYELGMKSDWLDNSLRVNLTAFYTDVSDFQLPSAFRTATGGIVFITRNFADLENKGLEGEVIWSPIDPLTLFANVGFQDSEYKNIDPTILAQQQSCQAGGSGCGQGIVDLDGNIADPVRSPDYTLNLGFNYVWPIFGSYELIPSAYLYTVGDHNVGTSGLPAGLVDSYSTYNASIALNNIDQDWSLTVGCKNCNDRTMVVSLLAGLQYLQDPRTWGVTFRKNFGGK